MKTEEKIEKLEERCWGLAERLDELARVLGYNFRYVSDREAHYELEKTKPTATEGRKKK